MAQDFFRTCVGCQMAQPAASLVRVVKASTGFSLELPNTKVRRPGRGAYLCFKSACFKVALRKKGKRPPLAFFLRSALPPELIEELQRVVEVAD